MNINRSNAKVNEIFNSVDYDHSDQVRYLFLFFLLFISSFSFFPYFFHLFYFLSSSLFPFSPFSILLSLLSSPHSVLLFHPSLLPPHTLSSTMTSTLSSWSDFNAEGIWRRSGPRSSQVHSLLSSLSSHLPPFSSHFMQLSCSPLIPSPLSIFHTSLFSLPFSPPPYPPLLHILSICVHRECTQEEGQFTPRRQ